MIHSSNITNNVAAFFPFNLMEGVGGRGSDVCVFVHPPHDLQTFDSVCVHPSHDLQTLLTSVSIHLITCRLLTMFESIHLMTCRHFWQCLCPSSSWPADTFDNFCVHPSYDLQTLLTVFLHPSISWHASIYFWQWALLSLDNTTFSFSVFYKLFWSRVQFDTDAIILYFRHHDKDTLSTCGN